MVTPPHYTFKTVMSVQFAPAFVHHHIESKVRALLPTQFLRLIVSSSMKPEHTFDKSTLTYGKQYANLGLNRNVTETAVKL